MAPPREASQRAVFLHSPPAGTEQELRTGHVPYRHAYYAEIDDGSVRYALAKRGVDGGDDDSNNNNRDEADSTDLGRQRLIGRHTLRHTPQRGLVLLRGERIEAVDVTHAGRDTYVPPVFEHDNAIREVVRRLVVDGFKCSACDFVEDDSDDDDKTRGVQTTPLAQAGPAHEHPTAPEAAANVVEEGELYAPGYHPGPSIIGAALRSVLRLYLLMNLVLILLRHSIVVYNLVTASQVRFAMPSPGSASALRSAFIERFAPPALLVDLATPVLQTVEETYHETVGLASRLLLTLAYTFTHATIASIIALQDVCDAAVRRAVQSMPGSAHAEVLLARFHAFRWKAPTLFAALILLCLLRLPLGPRRHKQRRGAPDVRDDHVPPSRGLLVLLLAMVVQVLSVFWNAVRGYREYEDAVTVAATGGARRSGAAAAGTSKAHATPMAVVARHHGVSHQTAVFVDWQRRLGEIWTMDVANPTAFAILVLFTLNHVVGDDGGVGGEQ